VNPYTEDSRRGYQTNGSVAKIGSGSVEGGSTSKIVTMKKQVPTYFVHYHRFREGQRLPDHARQPLPQRVIEALDMRRLPTLDTNPGVLLSRNYCRIRFPKVTVTVSTLIRWRNRFPQFATRRFTSIANSIGHHLASTTAQSNPNPPFTCFFQDERPEFIEFQSGRILIFWVRLNKRLTQWRQLCSLFLIHSVTVLRATPNVRVNPRKELRSS